MFRQLFAALMLVAAVATVASFVPAVTDNPALAQCDLNDPLCQP